MEERRLQISCGMLQEEPFFWPAEVSTQDFVALVKERFHIPQFERVRWMDECGDHVVVSSSMPGGRYTLLREGREVEMHDVVTSSSQDSTEVVDFTSQLLQDLSPIVSLVIPHTKNTYMHTYTQVRESECYIANERTYLAYVRTSLNILTATLSFLFWSHWDEVIYQARALVVLVSVLLTASYLGMFFLGCIRYRYVRFLISRHSSIPLTHAHNFEHPDHKFIQERIYTLLLVTLASCATLYLYPLHSYTLAIYFS